MPTNEELLHEVMRILAAHERLVMATKRASAADPFVIGLAHLRGAVVVTEEGRGSEGKPTIPFVCDTSGVACISLLGLIRAEKWVMGRH